VTPALDGDDGVMEEVEEDDDPSTRKPEEPDYGDLRQSFDDQFELNMADPISTRENRSTYRYEIRSPEDETAKASDANKIFQKQTTMKADLFEENEASGSKARMMIDSRLGKYDAIDKIEEEEDFEEEEEESEFDGTDSQTSGMTEEQ
jgi:hypothetical protein